ncbi:interleukin-36 gamma [Dasypus novemcinctus]|uniref:interleukin-36 gamma n=1 Tax=Dasypus novemcinctus TaxID=9361 RepID=UPI00266007B2|nr:interleukin-36 gamma [Dasypus novemcinctus]XP_058133981.1 interleukin-36 gamma [Dasypus novemcinctus]
MLHFRANPDHSKTLQAAHPEVGIISDLNQQVWALQNETLVAVPQSGNAVPVKVAVFPCQHREALEQGKGDPIYMGIDRQEICLSCEDAGKPTLQLKKQNLRDLYDNREPVKSFLFYHSRPGGTSTFESAAFPGWFIASSQKSEPLCLTSELGTTYNTAFNFEIKT